MAVISVMVIPLKAQQKVTTYFPNTEFELNVYHVTGAGPGPTMMLLGGIQDEPGGYLTADQFVDISLSRGNLIIIPRSNFETIIAAERGVHGDMNRMFKLTGQRFDNDLSFEVVQKLKHYIDMSDVLVTLHEGSGFYRETYIDDMHQPLRYGQSVIIDAGVYAYRENGDEISIDLGQVAEQVCSIINTEIEDEHHYFRLNNHDTFSPTTKHREQRLSASFYAVSEAHIPAFCIETSKNISDRALKIRYQTLAINAFMKEFNIIRDVINKSLSAPLFEFAAVSINGAQPLLYRNQGTIMINPGDSLKITHIETNYERGLSADILDYGRSNDFGRPVTVYGSTSIVFRKDNHALASVNIKAGNGDDGDSRTIFVNPKSAVKSFVLEVNGTPVKVSRDGILKVMKGDIVRIIDTIPSYTLMEGSKIDFFGFVPRFARKNTGDDRGHLIDTARDLMPYYSSLKEGTEYRIQLNHGEDIAAQMRLRLVEPELNYLLLKTGNGNKAFLENSDVYTLGAETVLEIVGVSTNIPNNTGVTVNVLGFAGKNGADDMYLPFNITGLIQSFSVDKKGRKYLIEINFRGRPFGRAYILLPGGSFLP